MTVIAFLILILWIANIHSKLNKLEVSLKTLTSIEQPQIIEPSKVSKLPAEPVKEPSIVEKEFKTPDFENFFMGNIFNKVGAIALIIGISIFIKLVAPYIIFTPVMKISLGFLAGIGMIFGAYKIHKGKLEKYAEVLTGTGYAILFITTYCANSLFHIFSNPISILIASIILIASYISADRQKTVSMLAIALIGGYLNLFFTAELTSNFLLGYLIFQNILSLIFVYRNPDKQPVNIINLLITFIIGSLYLLFHEPANIIYPLTLWCIYLIYDILRKEKDEYNVLNWLNFGILTLFSIIIFKDARTYIGIMILSAGLIYTGLAYYYMRKISTDYKPYIYSMLVSVLLSTFFLTNGIYKTSIWALEALIISLTAYKFKLEYLQNWVFAFLSASVTSIFFIDNAVYTQDINTYVPILNNRILAFGFPIISAFASYLMFSKDKIFEKTGEILRFITLSLIYLYISFEANDALSKYLTSSKISQEFIKQMIFTIIGFKYSLQARRIYNLNKFELFNTGAVIVGAISLIVLVTAGYNYSPLSNFIPVINIRFLAFATAIITSIIYAKWTKENFFKYLSAVLGFWLINIETADLADKLENMPYLQSVMWILYAGIISITGIFKNKDYLRITGIWISILTILRIFIYDLANIEAIYKLAAFLTLGTILMIMSYYYNKYKQ